MFGLLFNLVIGFILCLNGYRVWVRKDIRIVHGQNAIRVRKEDLPAYARLVGISLMLVGVGVIAAGVITYLFQTGIGYILLGILFLVACVFFVKAQKTYNT